MTVFNLKCLLDEYEHTIRVSEIRLIDEDNIDVIEASDQNDIDYETIADLIDILDIFPSDGEVIDIKKDDFNNIDFIIDTTMCEYDELDGYSTIDYPDEDEED